MIFVFGVWIALGIHTTADGAKAYPDDIDGYIRHKSDWIAKVYREIDL